MNSCHCGKMKISNVTIWHGSKYKISSDKLSPTLKEYLLLNQLVSFLCSESWIYIISWTHYCLLNQWILSQEFCLTTFCDTSPQISLLLNIPQKIICVLDFLVGKTGHRPEWPFTFYNSFSVMLILSISKMSYISAHLVNIWICQYLC